MSSPPEEPVVGALLGLALGDALGFVVEAAPPETARTYARGFLRRGRAEERRHPDFPFGQYSDDTQLARELLLSIADGGWHPARFGARLAALVVSGRDVGAGPGTRSAAIRLALGAPWPHAGTPAPYAGNGSAMRVAPVGALYRVRETAWRRCALEQSRLTHRDPRCAAGAIAIAGAAALATRPGAVEPGSFLEQVAAWAEPESAAMAAAVRESVAWIGLEPAAAAERLRRARLDEAWAGTWLGISAFVVPSVVWSLYAFLRSPDDWWETACTAIEVGGDTDTMAAMAGAVAGARLGRGALPAALLERLNDRGAWGAEALAALAARCAAVAAPVDSGRAEVILGRTEPRIAPTTPERP